MTARTLLRLGRSFAAAAGFAAAAFGYASAATISVYGYSSTAIYTVSTTTGAATSIYTFPTALKQGASLAVRASDGMIFYADHDGTSNVTTVYRWNPATPATAPILLGTAGTTLYLPRLGFGPDGKLYAMDQNATRLYVIDQTTGAATAGAAVSGIASGGGDMAFGPTGTLYVAVGTTLYSVPLAGGAATTLGSLSIAANSAVAGIAFDGAGRMLLENDDIPSKIYALTLPSLTLTQLGTAGGSVQLGDLGSVVAPDVQITTSHTGYFIAQGPTATYQLQAKNSGNGVTSGTITVVDTLPAGLTYVSASGTGWSCSAAGQIVTCTSSTAVGANANANAITLGVTAQAAAVPSVTNTVTIAGGNEPAPFTGNDTASDVTAVGGLTVRKTVDNVQVHPGDIVTFTLTYTNNNPIGTGSIFQTIVIADVIPASMTFASATCTAPLPAALSSCTVTSPAVGGTGTVKWTLAGALNPGGTGAVVVKARVQ